MPKSSNPIPMLARAILTTAFMSAAFTSLFTGIFTAAHAASPFENTIAQRVQACTACHGPQGRAAPDGYYPRLAGKPAGYLYNQLLNFREERRHYALMTQLLTPLTGPAGDAYLMEIAQYFSSLDVPYPASPPSSASPELLRLGQRLATQGDPSRQVPACVQCHGLAMTGVAPNIPGLLGLPRDYLNAQLGAWQTSQRRAHAPDCMKTIVNRLSMEDINAVATWIAAQPLPVSTKPALALPPLPEGGERMDCGSAPGVVAPTTAPVKVALVKAAAAKVAR